MDERAVFLAAIKLEDPLARAAFLNTACCDNPELRQRVELLLKSHKNQPLQDVLPFDDALDAGRTTSPLPTSRGLEDLPIEFALSSSSEFAPVSQDGDDSLLNLLLPSTKPGSIGRLAHYEIIELVGKGGFGTVLKAFDELLHRLVAIKMMSSSMATASPARKRFLREARASAAMRHENIVNIYSVNEDPIPYLVMEYIPGTTLQQRLETKGPLETIEVLRLGKQIASGLAAAHARGLIHRDIKPANIILEEGPSLTVKITDFGLARTADDASVSKSGVIAGTPMYMSPEQATSGQIDQRSDLFSLGSVLYHMLTGRPPFRAATTFAVLKRVTEDTPRNIHEIIPEAPAWLCQIIAKLHAKEPQDRYQTASEVAEVLERYLADWKAAAKDPNQPLRLPQTPDPELSQSQKDVLNQIVSSPTLLEPAGGQVGQGALDSNTPDSSERISGRRGARVVVSSVALLVIGALLYQSWSPSFSAAKIPPADSPQSAVDAAVNKPDQKPAEGISPADADWIRKVQALPAAAQMLEVRAELQRRNPEFKGELNHSIENNVVARVSLISENISDISPIRALSSLVDFECPGFIEKPGTLQDLRPLAGLPLTRLACRCNQIADLTPLRGMKLTYLDIGFNPVIDLVPLMELPLTELIMHGAPLSDLSPLRGLPLKILGIDHTAVTDLSPLKTMALTALSFEGSPVSSLTPLSGMKLEMINCRSSQVADLAPLQGMPLKVFLGDLRNDRDIEYLRTISSITLINGQPAAEILKQSTPPPTLAFAELSPKWVRMVRAMKPDARAREVIAELQRRNPELDSERVEFKISDGLVDELQIVSDVVADLSPVQALPGLTVLYCRGTAPQSGMLANLLPLKGLNLHYLSVVNNRVTDLTPLAGMKLKGLSLDNNPVSDLSPLKEAELERGYFSGTKVQNISVLKGMPVQSLHINEAQVADKQVLRELPLDEVSLNISSPTDLALLRSIKTLTAINDVPTSQFWKERGYGPFPPLSADWLKQVQTLKNEELIQEVAAELRRRNPEFDGKLTHLATDDRVSELHLAADHITDLSPVSVLQSLKELRCAGTMLGTPAKLASIAPLSTLKLERIDLSNSHVSDLTPLSDMPLKTLMCAGTPVFDLTPLKTLPLVTLSCEFIPQRDAPLLRTIPTLETLNDRPATELLK